jgi:Iap family predicted aminopeptidase
LSWESRNYVHKKDFFAFLYSSNNNLEAEIGNVGEGCEDKEFEGFKRGNIAIIKYGGKCTLLTSITLSRTFGAVGVVFHYEQHPQVNSLRTQFTLPVMAVPKRLALEWLSSGKRKIKMKGRVVKLKMYTNMKVVGIHTKNIILDTINGDENKVIVMGSHLDGVSWTTGMNDNGSGKELKN